MGQTQGRDGKMMTDDGSVKARGPSRFGRQHSNDSMGHSPPDSPSGAARSPLMFTPQVGWVSWNRMSNRKAFFILTVLTIVLR